MVGHDPAVVVVVVVVVFVVVFVVEDGRARARSGRRGGRRTPPAPLAPTRTGGRDEPIPRGLDVDLAFVLVQFPHQAVHAAVGVGARGAAHWLLF